MTLIELIAKIRVDGAKQAESDFKGVKGAAQDAAVGVRATAASFGAMAAAVASASIAQKAFSAAVDYDSAVRALATVANGADDLRAQIARLREIAKAPGLGFSEAIIGSARLQSAGLSAQLAERSLREFANAVAASGGGKEQLDGITVALAQIAGKGKVTAEEINQIAERFFGIRQALQGAFGTTDTERIQKMGLTVDQFFTRVLDQMAKAPRVVGGLRNAIDNLGDNLYSKVLVPLGQIQGAVFMAFGSQTTGVIGTFGNLLAWLQKQSGLLAAGLTAVGSALAFIAAQRTVAGVMALVAAITQMVKVVRALGISNAIAQALSTGGASALPALAGAATVAIGAPLLWDKLESSLSNIKDVSGGIGPGDMAAGTASPVPTGVGDFSKVMAGLKDGLPGAAQFGINLLAEQRARTERMLAGIEKNTRDTADILSLRKQAFGGGAIAQAGATATELRRSGINGNAPGERDYGRRPASSQVEDALQRLNRRQTNQILRRGRRVV